MILEYNRKPDATVDEKIQSLMESTQLALNDISRAQQTADVAKEDAQTSVALAQTARQAANEASESAAEAKQSAEEAAEAVEEIEGDVSGLKTRVTQAEDDIDAAESSISSLGTRVGTAEGAITTIEGNVTSLGNRVTAAEGDIDAVEGSVSSLSSRVTAAEGDIDAVEGNITNLSGRVSDAESDITTVEGNITTLSGRVSDAEEDVDNVLKGLSIAEDILGVLELVAEHGDYAPAIGEDVQPNKWYFIKISEGKYQVVNNPTSLYHLTSDVTIDPTKTYYTRTGSGTELDPYVYTVVQSPSQAALSTYYEKYYELVGIDNSIKNYVSSHLVLTGNTLQLRTDNSPFRLELSSTGMQIVGASGVIASYGTNTIIGSENGFHVKIDGTELGFYDKTGSKVAYVRNDQLFIERSVVVQQMDVGTKAVDGGLGQWSWKVHEVNGQNNLYLKWLG